MKVNLVRGEKRLAVEAADKERKNLQ